MRKYAIAWVALSGLLAAACDRGTGGTSKAGPAAQTVDSEFRVHRDPDGSVPGRPGISPYEGRIDEKQMAGTADPPAPKPSAAPRSSGK
jgi:hypothetical protein